MKRTITRKGLAVSIGLLVLWPMAGLASSTVGVGVEVVGIRLEFILFGLILLGVALFHRHTMPIAVSGLLVILAYKLFWTPFNAIDHMGHEWRMLLNLFGLLMGFAILAKHFEESQVPAVLPNWLPDGWVGGMVLLWMVCVLSSFLDNIAAAMIGGTIAMVVFKRKVHIGFLAAIVAASNAGGAGSVVGDTTTTMMWIDGVSAFNVLHAYVGAGTAMIMVGVIAGIQQDRYESIIKTAASDIRIDWGKLSIVAMILVGAILANVLIEFPAAGVWGAIVIGALFRKTSWHELGGALKGSIFLLSLVLCASMMPVETLPPASWITSLELGFVSAVFDNIPLTKLALVQGGYDWGFVAYAVGFGGSMIWFGSSAGVALSNMFPQAKSVGAWLKHGWYVTVAYMVGFMVMLFIMGWHPHAPHKQQPEREAPASISEDSQ